MLREGQLFTESTFRSQSQYRLSYEFLPFAVLQLTVKKEEGGGCKKERNTPDSHFSVWSIPGNNTMISGILLMCHLISSQCTVNSSET